MGAKVCGQGILFLGTACGPALTPEQRDYLKGVNPDDWYPVEKLQAILQTARERDVNLVRASGKSWGQVIKQRLEAEGVDNPKDALVAVCQVYKRDHKDGEVGDLVPHDATDSSLRIEDTSIYPSEMLGGVWESLTTAYGAYEVSVNVTDREGGGVWYAVNWKMRE